MLFVSTLKRKVWLLLVFGACSEITIFSLRIIKESKFLKLFTLKLSIVFNIVIWPLEWKVFQGRVLLEYEKLSSMFVFTELVGIESHSTERRCGRPDESLLQYLAVAKT